MESNSVKLLPGRKEITKPELKPALSPRTNADVLIVVAYSTL